MRRGAGRDKALADRLYAAALSQEGPFLLCSPSHEAAERVLRLVPVCYRFRVRVLVPDSGDKKFMASLYDDIIVDEAARIPTETMELLYSRLRTSRETKKEA